MSVNERTGLDCPSLSATASNVPQAPAGSVPAHPEGDLAWRFQAIESTRGTPRVNRTAAAPDGLHAAESHTTRPCLVTTTWTEPGP